MFGFWWWEEHFIYKERVNMLNARINKRKLMYSNVAGEHPEYKTDDEGNILYITIKGQKIPQETGEYKITYSEPVEFMGNVNFSSGEAEAQAFGITIGDYDSKLFLLNDEIPIDETSLIFMDSEPKYDELGYLIRESADFQVVKVAPSINFTNYLLKRITK